MTVQEAILLRRSARSYEKRDIAPEIIEELLRMAQAAPSGGNSQQHVFGIVRDSERRTALARAAGGQMWIASAPVLVACCARLDEDWRTLPEDDFGLRVNRLRFGAGFLQHLLAYPNWQETAVFVDDAVPLIPAEHMVLAAKAHGIEGCIVGLLDVQAASRILELPENIRCLYLLPLGYPAKKPGEKTVKSLEELSFYETYQTEHRGRT